MAKKSKRNKTVTSVMVSFRADASLFARIKALAGREDRKVADSVRRLVISALDGAR